jgi:hypothetical protein
MGYGLDLLTPSCTMSLNRNQLQQLRINGCLRLAPFSLSLSQNSILNCQLRNSALITILHGKDSLFTAPLPSSRSIAPRVCFCRNVFSDPLPSDGHSADHIENASCNTFSVEVCTYFGRCLEMGLRVTVLTCR